MHDRLKAIIRSSFSCFFIVACYANSSLPEQDPPIPQAVISSIVNQTLAITSPANSQQPTARDCYLTDSASK